MRSMRSAARRARARCAASPRRRVERDEGRDAEAVLAGVDVLVDARDAERAPPRVVPRVVDVAVDEARLLVVRADVGVLADQEGAVGAREERAHVARDPPRVARSAGSCVAA